MFSTEHTYRVRSVSADGHYSNWSKPITLMTDDDPFRNTPYPTNIDWEAASTATVLQIGHLTIHSRSETADSIPAAEILVKP